MGQLTIQQTFDLALQHHQAGRLREAEQAYRQILASQPGHADALHMLGVTAYQVGRHDVAADLIRQAITRQPNWPEAYYNLGNALRNAGQADQAIAVFRQVIALKPNWPEAHHNLGNALGCRGQLDESIAAFRQAIALKPDYLEAYYNLGNALKDNGCLDECIVAYRQVLALNPDFAEAHNNLGSALRDKGSLDQAIAACRQAIALKPDYADAYSNLGAVLKEKGCVDEAIATCRQAIALNPKCIQALNNLGAILKDQGHLDQSVAAYRQAIALRPDMPQTYCNLAVVLHDQEKLDEAMAACRQAIALKPDYAEAHTSLGGMLQDEGQMDQAIAAFRQAIALKPDYVEAHWDLALSLLATGDFTSGWEEFEWRLKMPWSGLNRGFPQKQWDGSDPTGKTILLHAEGGLGDGLQFVRLVPMLRGRDARFILECQPALVPLLSQIAGIEQIIARGQPLPMFDWHSPLQSLPRILGITLDNMPSKVPYLIAPNERVRQWALRVPAAGQLNVGLVWAGSSGDPRRRSQSLDMFKPLARVPGVRFFSVQIGPQSTQKAPERMHLIDYTSELHDFADTAALVQNLDLVISVDTSVAHLAGAMARPVWVLIPARSDFRWLLHRTDSPWYPTMRLFRQSAVGDWDSVVQQVVTALVGLAQRR